jgi:hypothetical protein
MNRNITALIFVLLGCSHPLAHADEQADDLRASNLIRTKCLACHNSSTAEADVVIETREQLMATHNDKVLIVPGKHADSWLWHISARKAEPAMPPADNKVNASPLNEEEIQLLAGWIDRGAKWVDAPKVTMAFRDLPADQLPIQSIAMQTDGSRAAVAWGNRVGVIRVPGGEVESWLLDPQLVNPSTGTAIKATDIDFVQSIAMSADGTLIATGGFRTFRLWKKKNVEREVQWAIESAQPGKWVVGATHALFVRDDGSFSVLDRATGAAIHPNNLLLTQPIHALNIHPTEPILAVCRKDQVVLTYHLGTNEIQVIGRVAALPEQLFALGNGDVAALRGGNFERFQFKPFVTPAVDAAPVATVAATDLANELVVLLHKNQPELKTPIDLNAIANSPYADAEVANLQWNSQIATRHVQVAEADVKAAQDELKGEETNKQTLDGELTKSQTAVDEAKKELAGKPDDMAIAEKVKKAEGALETAKDTLKRADERIVALKERITMLEGVTNQEKQLAEQSAKVLADFQTQVGTGIYKPVAIGADRDRAGWRAIVDNKGTLSLLDANNQTVCSIADQAKDAVSLKSLGNQRWWVGYANGRAEVWNLQTGWDLVTRIGNPVEQQPFVDRVLSLAFNPAGTKIAIGCGEPSRGGSIYIFDIATSQIVLTKAEAHSDVVVSLAYSPNGKYLASGGADRMAKLWQAESLEPYKTLEGHTHHVNSVSWKCDSRQLLTASADTTTKLWDVVTAQQIKTVDLGDAELNAALYVAQLDHMLVAASTQPVTRRNTNDAGQHNAYACESDYTFGIAIDRNGQRILAGGSQGVLRGFKLDQTALFKISAPTLPQ